MSIQLNHTIVAAHDKQESAKFLADLLGLEAPAPFGPFMAVTLDNDVTLDYVDAGDGFPSQHLAFLISESEFDTIFGRIRDRNMPYWADPHHNQPNEINHNDGGRGVYFEDHNGHNLELITRPYGSGG